MPDPTSPASASPACLGAAGRLVRLVVGSESFPAPAFFAPDAPRFAPSAGLRVEATGDRHVVKEQDAPLLTVAARTVPFFLSVDIPGGARVYGFGAATGAASRGGARFRVLTRDTLFFGVPGASYTAFPLFWVKSAQQCFAVLVATTFPLDVEVGDTAVVLRGACDTEKSPVDVILLRGSPVDIAEDLGALVGRTFLPPAWALGFHQSRWSYKTQGEVLAVARRLRAESLPADVVHLDIHYMDRYRVFTFSPERFPNPRALHDELATLGIRTLAIIDPGVSVAPYRAHDEGMAEGIFCTRSDKTPYVGKVWPGATVFPDFTREKVRDAWARFHAPLLDAGIGGFWNDMNDPVLKVGEVYDPLAEDLRHGEYGEVPHRRVRNLYANQMATATVKALKEARPKERPFVLTRSGFLGIQRHSAVWTGDNLSTWEHLRQNLNMVLNLGLCGVPVCGADIGGFGGRPGKYGAVKWRPPAELFVRWMELGALMPFMRVHTTLYSPRQEPWSFGKAALEHSRRLLRRRYQLLPLLYRLVLEAHQRGLPVVRPAWLEHEVDPAKVEDIFMLGNTLLGAPVLEAGVTARKLLLPPGAWIDYDTGEVVAGGRVVERKAPLGHMPLFLKAGAPLFTLGVGRNAEETLKGALALEVSAPPPGSLGRGSLFLDDGIESDGKRFLMDVEAEDLGGRLRVRFAHREQGFTPLQTELELRAPRAFERAVVDGATLPLVPKELGREGRAQTVSAARVPLSAREIVLE